MNFKLVQVRGLTFNDVEVLFCCITSGSTETVVEASLSGKKGQTKKRPEHLDIGSVALGILVVVNTAVHHPDQHQ